jgi:hypothetical protein
MKNIYKTSTVLSTVVAGLLLVGCGGSSLSSSGDESSTQAVDGYVIGLGGVPAQAVCGDLEYNSSLSVGLNGKINFDGASLTKDCTITIPKTAIIDMDNNGEYNSSVDGAIGFEMQSFGDMAYTSHLTSIAVANPNNLELANLVKNFNPVEDVDKAVDDVKFQKLFVLGEIVKTVMKNGTTANLQELVINVSEIESSDTNVSSFDVSSIINNLSDSNIKTVANERATIVRDVVSVLKDLKDDVNIKDMFIRISDKQQKPSDAISSTIKETSTKTITQLKSDITTIANMDTQYDITQEKIENLPPVDETDVLENLMYPSIPSLGNESDEVDTNITDFDTLNPPQTITL